MTFKYKGREKEYRKEYQTKEGFKEYRRKYMKKRRLENSLEIRAYHRNYYATKFKDKAKAYYLKNRDKILSRARERLLSPKPLKPLKPNEKEANIIKKEREEMEKIAFNKLLDIL